MTEVKKEELEVLMGSLDFMEERLSRLDVYRGKNVIDIEDTIKALRDIFGKY